MITSTPAPRGQTTTRLLGCSTSPLPPLAMADADPDDRFAALLEYLVGVARGSSGILLLGDDAGRLAVRKVTGWSAPLPPPDLMPSVADLDEGLTIHRADLGEPTSTTDEHAHAHTVLDTAARMTLTMPLAWRGRRFGAVQVGFHDLRSLDPTELRRLRMIADHLACVAEAARLEAAHSDAQAEVERVSAVLEDIDRLKGEFLSMMSHELRTPLTAIIGYTDLLVRQIHGPLTDRQQKHQQAVRKAANRLLALINDLLDVNRMESGHVVLNIEHVALNDAVRRAVAQAAASAELRSVELRLDMPLAPVNVAADPDRLQQIVANLLDNAVKFTPPGGTVTVHLKQYDDGVTVSVIDTGIGVPPEQLERIWDRFHQADSGTRRQFGGTGLGLAIVRHLVELHGGTVSVASAGAGEGSTFRVSLPIVTSETAPASTSPTGILPSPRQRRTILIVDDEPDNCEVIASIVEDIMGHQIRLATNGVEALDAAKDSPDLVLLDLRMPGMSGFEVARELRASPATCHLPIVAITALNDEHDRQAALDAGCNAWVSKPFTQEALVSIIEAALGASVPGAIG